MHTDRSPCSAAVTGQAEMTPRKYSMPSVFLTCPIITGSFRNWHVLCKATSHFLDDLESFQYPEPFEVLSFSSQDTNA